MVQPSQLLDTSSDQAGSFLRGMRHVHLDEAQADGVRLLHMCFDAAETMEVHISDLSTA